MAHPDATRQGNEKGQREHAGRDSEATDAGVQRHAQNSRGPGPVPAEGDDGAQPGDAGAAGAQGQGGATAAAQAQGAGVDRPQDAAPAAGGGEAAVPPGESRILEGRPALADRGLQASSPDPAAESSPGASPPR